jgi:hypothetical protein
MEAASAGGPTVCTAVGASRNRPFQLANLVYIHNFFDLVNKGLNGYYQNIVIKSIYPRHDY